MGKPNQEERAFRAWERLVQAAADRDIMRYKELGRDLGIHHRAVQWALDPIHRYCIRKERPPLTILVVNETGLPGRGFTAWSLEHFEEGCEEVFGHPWETEVNPFAYAAGGVTAAALTDALLGSAQAAEELYRRINVRGVAQELFRRTLLKVYGSACCFCHFPFRQALDGAHIKPWAASAPHERLNVQNGILACRNHHALFDLGMLAIRDDYTVQVAPEAMSHLGELEGGRLQLPRLRSHWPAVEYLRWHRASVGTDDRGEHLRIT